MRDMTSGRATKMLRSGVSVLVIAMTVATSGGETGAAAARPTQWTVVVSEKTGGADPLSEYGTNSQYFLVPHVVEALVHLELMPDQRAWGVVPVLAEKWSFPDPRTLVIELRRGIKFQNGE